MQGETVLLSASKVAIQYIAGMIYFSLLTSISAKGIVVPGHVGSFHVYKVNINPEIDTSRNRLMGQEHGYDHLHIPVTVGIF